MKNIVVGLLTFILFGICAVLYIHTDAMFYVGLMFVSSAVSLCLLGKNKGFVLFFMILALIGVIFTAYQAFIYFV